MDTMKWFNKNRPPCGAPAVMSDKLIAYLEQKKSKTNADFLLLADLKKTEKEHGESVWIPDGIMESYYPKEEVV